MPRKLTTDEFIDKARSVHGDRYDYSQVEYVHSASKVKITCPEHGDFVQAPSEHLTGRGCQACGGKSRLTTEEFIKKAQSVHGDKFDYSQVEYVSARTKVEIGCPEHGDFVQAPRVHLHGTGCPYCSRMLCTLTLDEFIDKARAVHGDKYSYERTVYVNNETKVEILCPAHGSCWQKPTNHLSGSGCPRCGKRNKTEGLVEDILRKHYPDVVCQYPIKGSEFNMRGDFYIPSIDTLVEWNGAQHYRPVKAWGGLEAFERQQLRDADLRATCAETCMKLCVIDARPYSPVRNPPTESDILDAIQEAQQ